MRQKPLLRWAGGKRWLTNKINKFLPKKINSYYEPFCGSCAIFFSIQDKLVGKKVFLSDSNIELINFYKNLQTNPEKICNYLKYYNNDKDTYYELRGRETQCDIEKAAIFYYLNRTSFNGIYRVNLKGVYNVPYGYKNYKILFNYDDIMRCADLLQRVDFICDDFTWIEGFVDREDLVFLDPPYTVSHNNNGFIKYNKNLFSLHDQFKLKDTISCIDKQDAFYILTNAYHEAICNIFSSNAYCVEMDRYTQISGKANGRKSTKEYIFYNFA